MTAQPFARDRNAITYCICMFSALSASESISPCGGNCLFCQLVNYSLENLYLSTCHTDIIHFELAVRSIVSKMLSSFRRCVNFSAEIYRGRFSY